MESEMFYLLHKKIGLQMPQGHTKEVDTTQQITLSKSDNRN